MATLTVGDTPISYDTEGDGPPLLLLHAGIVDRRMWDPVWESLTARFHAVRPDLRGFGQTPNPSGSHAHWRDAAALLRGLELGPVDVMGISMGASAALELALSAPEMVRRLVLIAPGLAGWDWAPSLRAAWEAEEAAYEAGDLDEMAWINVRAWLDGPHRDADAVPAQLRQAVFAMQRAALDLDNDAAVLETLDPPARTRLGEVVMPCLVVVGNLDQPDMVRIARHLAVSLPDARLEVLPGVAHLPPMEAPSAFLDAVLPFLEG
jgi:pimeloyl-ACP methyl ester carboxylesterase